MANDSFAEAHALHLVDTSKAKDGVWLVKVPNYLADLWLKSNNDGVVGKVVISQSTQPGDPNKKPESQVQLVTDETLIAESGDAGKLIPKEHEFLIQSTQPTNANKGRPGLSRPSSVMSGQELLILCEDEVQPATKAGTPSSHSSSPRNNKRYSIFGRVNSRAECQPPPDSIYMNLKAQQLKAKNRARHEVQILEEPVRHRPLNNHEVNIENERRKKKEGKNLRREREDVLQDLFKAFEGHQYYAFKDLLLLTKQPANYLGELLREIAIFSSKPPHQHMWELKPEYRHYAAKDIPKPNSPGSTATGIKPS